MEQRQYVWIAWLTFLLPNAERPFESRGKTIDTPYDRYEITPIKKQKSIFNRVRKCGLVPRRDMNASGSGISPSFGDMSVSVEGHDSDLSEQVDWSVWAVSVMM